MREDKRIPIHCDKCDSDYFKNVEKEGEFIGAEFDGRIKWYRFKCPFCGSKIIACVDEYHVGEDRGYSFMEVAPTLGDIQEKLVAIDDLLTTIEVHMNVARETYKQVLDKLRYVDNFDVDAYMSNIKTTPRDSLKESYDK